MSPIVPGQVLAGVDIGGSKIAVRLSDTELRPIARSVAATEVGEAGAPVERVVDAVDAALATAGLGREALAAVGIGVPGRIDPLSGTVFLAVNLGWHEVPLGPIVAGQLGVPVVVENDVKAAAAGLRARDLTGGFDDVAYVGVGTGIAAGIVLGGRLFRGSRGLAGEIGHVVVDVEGPRCECGLHGCLEAVASGRGVTRVVQAALDGGAASRLADARPLTAAAVYAAADAGDPLARSVVEAAGLALARAIHQLVMTYDVRRVLLGGGVTAAGATFRDPIEHGLAQLRAASPLAREVLPPDLVDVLPADADPGAWGAVVLAREAARAIPPARADGHHAALPGAAGTEVRGP